MAVMAMFMAVVRTMLLVARERRRKGIPGGKAF